MAIEAEIQFIQQNHHHAKSAMESQPLKPFHHATLSVQSGSSWAELLGPFNLDITTASTTAKSSAVKKKPVKAHIKNGSLFKQQLLSTSEDDVRVYIDEFKDVGEGKLYKGQWNKKTGEREGVGI